MKLSSHYTRPTLLGRLQEDGNIKGSIRGLNNSCIDSFRNLLLKTNLFEYISGHNNAAGFSIAERDVGKMIKYLNDYLKDINLEENFYNVNFIKIAADKDLINLIQELGSCTDLWGQKNSEPLIYISDINIKKEDIQIIGSRLDTVKFEKFGVTYIKFFAKDFINDLKKYDEIKIELVGKANLNNWGGRTTPQIIIENYELSDNKYGF